MPIPLAVLLLEDREEDALLILHALKAAGFAPEWRRVDTEEDFVAALEASLDVILADYRLPGFSGLEALAALQATGLDVPFIIVSGTIGEDSAVEAMRRGAADYLLKDRLARLGPAVQHQLDGKRMRLEKRMAEAVRADERLREEEALRESEERHRLLFQSNPLPMWVFDLETLRVLTVNEAAVRHYGYSEAEFLASTIKDIRPLEVLPQLEEALTRARAGNERVSELARHRKKNGEIIEVEVSANSLVFGGREARLVLAVDVTKRLRDEIALREAAALLRIAGRTARLGAWSIGVPPVRFTLSEEMCAILELDYPLEPALEEFLELFLPEWRESFHQAVLTCMREGKPFDLDVEVMAGSGRRGWGRCIGEAERDAAGVITQVHGSFQDITDRMAAAEALRLSGKQLERANRLASLGRLAATIAHEFNNVLMGIQPFADVIARTAGSQENLVKAAGHITSSVKRGKRITQEILRFSQPAQPVLQPVSLQSWLRELEVEVRPLLPGEITLVVDAGPSPVEVLGDPSQLQQVFVNLLLNAKDAMPNGGRLAVSAMVDSDDAVYPFGYVEQPSRFVRLVVSDTGGGMSSETMEHIFEPLFTTKQTGTGLGLAVTHQVVRGHGGEIFVESEEGHGTSFHLFLPRANGAA